MDAKSRKRYDAVVQKVADQGGIAVLAMWELRDASGYAKLGVHVVRTIRNHMDEAGLATLPGTASLPLDQYGMVRVYQQKSPIGPLVEAVTNPSGKGDDLLRRLAGDDASDVLEQIRNLVCGG